MVYTGLKVGLVVGGVVGSGALYKLILTPPIDIAHALVKHGYDLPKEDSEWRIMLEENMEEIKAELNLESNPGIENLKTFCEDLYKKSTDDGDSLDRATKYCIYFPKTIKGMILKNGSQKLLDENSEEKKWQALFNIQRYSTEFNDSLSHTTTENLSWITTTDKGTPVLKTWCISTMKKEWRTHREEIHNVQKYCSDPGISTIEELIKVEDPKWELATNWEENVKVWKNTSNVQLNIGDSNIQKENLEKWCKEHKNDGLELGDSYGNVYRVVRDACRKL